MLFAFYCEDVPNSLQARLANRQAHLDNIGKLVVQGRVVLAGPFPKQAGVNPAECGFDGSLIVADFPSLEEAEQWINNDPYVTAGVLKSVVIRPFLQVLPNPRQAASHSASG